MMSKTQLAMERIAQLEEELKLMTTQRDLYKLEVGDLKHRIANLHEETANLRDALSGMSDDMGQLEGMLSQLRGIDG